MAFRAVTAYGFHRNSEQGRQLLCKAFVKNISFYWILSEGTLLEVDRSGLLRAM